ncbi:MAG TPA: pseudouridine synthase [Methylobacterium sp.]|nr:pseudouridine synthase [Methylobacterium sp.]
MPVPSNAAPAETHEGERIAKAIARAGIASRRDAEALIAEGRVTLNGRILASPAINVTEDDVITVDDEPLPARERTRLWVFHKPRGLVTTARDPEGRQTVFEALPDDLPRVVAVGRLDINTEGLLLLTNDGGLAKVIAHPDTGWLRRYRVRAHGDTNQAELDKLRKGVTIDGMEYGPIEANLDRVQGDNLWLTLGLREGKNREVKRILEHLGLSVNRLIRLSFGPFQLGDLEVGLVDEIRTKVLKEQLGPSLAAQAGVDFESPVREPIAPFGSPKASHATEQAPRPAKSAASADRKARGPAFGARPGPGAAPVRVPTGGMGAGPRRSVWRADEPAEDGPRAVRVPRRGADPRAERAAASERGRERVGAIKTGERRVVVERLKSSLVEETPEAAPRRYARAPDGSRPARPPRPDRGPDRGDRGPDRGGEERGFRPRPEGGRSDRSGGDRFGGRGAGDREDRGFRGGSSSGERSGGGRFGESGSRDFKPRDTGPRESKPWDARDRDSRDRDAKPRAARSGERSFGEREGGGYREGGFKGARPGGGGAPDRSGPRGGFGGKPGGDRTGGDKPRGDRSGGFGGKTGGFGGKPSGFGGKPGGARAGGGKPGGGFGGKPGGRPSGGKPGGFGGKPGGGGRPPRGGAR